MKHSILIKGGTIVTMNPAGEIIEPGYLLTKDTVIASLGKMGEVPPDHTVDEVMECNGCVIMPGLVNTHTHAAMTCFRGLSDDLPLESWLNEYIFPIEARYVNPDFVYHGTLLAGIEMIKSGTTCFCDGYFFEEAAARAVAELGLRGVMGQGIVDFPTPDVPHPEGNVKRGIDYLGRSLKSSLIIPTLFCHSAYTCRPETLKRVKEICKHHSVPFLIHAAETQKEVGEINCQWGVSPFQHLYNQGVLDGGTVAAHCVWVSPAEFPLLEKTRPGVSHCPESNMKLASGVAPVPDLLKLGIAVGLGTDGCASNNNLDMLSEMDTAAKIHKAVRMDPAVMDAKTVVRMATLGGAEVLGLHNAIGSLEAGKKADIIILDWSQPHLTPVYNYYSPIVYSATGHDVLSVLIDGKVVMRNRQVLTARESEAMRAVKEIAERIKKETRSLPHE